MASIVNTSVILKGSLNWVDWFERIREKAETYGVWEYIDPSADDRDAPTLTKPEYPAPEDIIPQAVAENREPTWLEKERLKAAQEKCAFAIQEYHTKEKRLIELNKLILDTISPYLHIRIRGVTDVRQRLKRLKEHCAPLDHDREKMIEAKIATIEKGPNRKNLDKWLQDFEAIMTEARQIGHTENHKAVRMFYNCVEHLYPDDIRDMRRELIRKSFKDYPTLEEVITDFQRIRTFYSSDRNWSPSPKERLGSFATLGARNEKGQKNSSETRPGKQPKGNLKCVCGEKHFYSQCFYLNPDIAPLGFKRDRKIAERINELLASNEELREKVARAQKNSKRSSKKKRNQPESQRSEESSPLLVHATMQVSNSLATSQHALKDSFILDTGSNVHICNNRLRFLDYQDDAITQEVFAGASTPRPLGRGRVQIYVNGPNGSRRSMVLSEALYIPDFHTSVVSVTRLNTSGVLFNNRDDTLVHDGRTFCHLERHHGQWVLEYNPIKESYDIPIASHGVQSSRTRPTLRGTPWQWHIRLGHVGKEAIQHLSKACEGVEITKGGPDISSCETCKFTKAQQKISPVPMSTGRRPFERFHLDLITLNEGIDGSKYVLHGICDFSRFVISETLVAKQLARQKLQNMLAYIERQFGQQVRVIRCDNETSLEPLFPYLRSLGIQVETTSAGAPSQNGLAERSWGVLTTRMRALRIDSGLPENLWPHIHDHAVFLINRTPTKSLGWKTPFQVLHDAVGRPEKPYLGNLRALGAAAYVRTQNISRKNKLDPRATKQERDVEFDESQRYSEERPWVESLMRTHEPPMAQPEVYDELSEASDDEIQYRRRRDDESSSGRTVSQPPVSGAPCENDNAKDLTPDDILQQDLQNTINGAAPTPGAWPTPEATPDQTPEPAESRISQIPSTSGPSSLESSSEIHGSVHSKLKTKRQPRSMAGIDPSNITEGKRQPKPRKDNDDYISTQFASFMAGTFENPSLHRSQLPPPPRHYGEARKHPFWPNWKRAMDEELGELDQRGVFRKIRRP
ncbi:hypothetical protein VTN49DRAFT_6151 [Thermomyces lanuginosus]|uniref:uncharacterized protein n=1 Tax=Thermomyces lanuginosus TaxID=5541 RepID=UPI0037439E16